MVARLKPSALGGFVLQPVAASGLVGLQFLVLALFLLHLRSCAAEYAADKAIDSRISFTKQLRSSPCFELLALPKGNL